MSTFLWVLVVLAVWVSAGVTAVVVLLGRQGHRTARWWLPGVVLGPLFLPIAAERGRHGVVVLDRRTAQGDDPDPGGVVRTVVVAVDGSAESDQAVRDAARLLGGAGTRFVLVTVVDPDVAEFDDAEVRAAADDLLAERARWLGAGAEPVLEIGCGRPSQVLVDVARAEGADLLMLGRRGRGLSRRVLGSVAEQVARQATTPVLLAGPPAVDLPAGGAGPAGPSEAQASGSTVGWASTDAASRDSAQSPSPSRWSRAVSREV
ncbi:universal stress protein [Modestobacter roseus]|uniref:universal stress protein n=1 Tax=Modestobacter roseus TaxID=1181884 RepID=UPI0034E02BFB